MEEGYVNEILPPLGSEEPTGEETPETPPETGAEPEEVETPAQEETEEATGEDTPADTEEVKKAKGVQKRIDELTKQKHEATRREQEKEKEVEYWKAQALKGQQPPEPQPEVIPQGFPAKPTVEQFESYEEFVEALTDWKVELKDVRKTVEAERKNIAEKQQTIAEQHSTRVQTAKAKYEDFDDVTSSLDGIMVPMVTIEVIQESEVSADLFYYLGQHPDEAKKLQTLSVPAQLREIGKLEARLEKKPEPEIPAKRVTQAPEPIKPVGNKEKAVAADPDNMSDEEWYRYENERLSKQGKLY